MQVFDFNNYTEFLQYELSAIGTNRGRRIKLAEFLGCQAPFLTQVMKAKVQLSLEHAIKACDFFKFNQKESDYFLLLVQKGKAGSVELEEYFQNKLNEIKEQREEIRNRINVQTQLDPQIQMKYYSVWFHSAIHILTAFQGFHTAIGIANKLNLDVLTVKESLEFLLEAGFIKQLENGDYHYRVGRLHLPEKSPMLPRHHANWRLKAIEEVDRQKADSLHYTAILGISKKDQLSFKGRLLELLEEFEPVIEESAVESEVILLFDLFEL